MNRMTTWLRTHSLIFASIFVIACCYVALFMYFYDDNPPMIVETPVHVLNEDDRVPHGGEIVMAVKYEKVTDHAGVVSITYLCGEELIHEEIVGGALPAGSGVLTIRERIPKELPVGGICVRHVAAEYRVNILAIRTVHWETEPFVVTEPE